MFRDHSLYFVRTLPRSGVALLTSWPDLMDLLTNGAPSFHWIRAGLSYYVSIIGGFKLFHCVLLTFLKITGTSQNQNKNTDLEQWKCEKMENLRMLVIAITILWRTTWSGHISQPVYKMSDACPVLGPLNCELVAVCQLAEQSSTSSPSSPTKASSVFCLCRPASRPPSGLHGKCH